MRKADISDSSDDTAGDGSDAGNRAKAKQPLFFIHHRGSSTDERRRNAYQARAHVIRLNRKSTTATQGPSLPKPARLDGVCPPPSSAKRDARLRGVAGKRQAIASPSIPQAVAPTWGALPIASFDQQREPASLRAAAHLSQVLWPSIAGRRGSREWLREFFSSEAAWHLFSFQAAIHVDFLRNKAEASIARPAITHKLNAIASLREMIARSPTLTAQEIEVCIHITHTLARNEILPFHLATERVLPFVPHFPRANEIHIWGRMAMIKEHKLAVRNLVMRMGGLDELRSRGLASLLALTDLSYACAEYSTPFFPCFWPMDVLQTLSRQRQSISPDRLGSGHAFSSTVGGLPPDALETLLNLVAVDNIMSRFNESLSDAMERLLSLRNAALHMLISLPTWSELSVEAKEGRHSSIYDICRLTSVIYATAVMLGMPPHLGWHVVLAARLRSLLETVALDQWREDASDLLMWSLFIGGLASYRSEHRVYFEETLRGVLRRRDLASWPSVRSILHGYLWSDSACE